MSDYKGTLDTLYWSPSEIATLATDLSNWGAEIETQIKTAYQIVDNLGTTGAWTGKLFNDLAELMNDQKGFFQDAVRVLADEIPTNMNASAKADADASEAAFTNFTPATISGDYEVKVTDDDGTGILTFTVETVESSNQEFNNALSTAVDNLNEYKSNFDSLFNEILSFRARAYEKYRGLVESTVSTCITKFQEFSDTFLNNAHAAQEAIETADESAAAQADNVTNIS